MIRRMKARLCNDEKWPFNLETGRKAKINISLFHQFAESRLTDQSDAGSPIMKMLRRNDEAVLVGEQQPGRANAFESGDHPTKALESLFLMRLTLT